MPSSSGDNRDSLRLAWIALVLAMVGAGAMLYYHQGLFLPRVRDVSVARGLGGGYQFGDDFYPVWLTSREALGGRDPYSAEMTREIQTGLFGRALDRAGDPKDLRTFAHPAYTLLLMWPLAAMRFEAARVAMGILLLGMMPASVWLWLKALGWYVRWPWMLVIVVLSVCSYPALEGLYSEQLGLAVAFLLAGAIAAVRRGRMLLAGVLIALTMIKPQMTLLVTAYVLLWSFFEIRMRVRFVVGLFTTLLSLVVMALMVWPRWIQEWVGVVGQYHGYAEPSLLGGLVTFLPGARLAGLVTALLTASAIIVGMGIAWRNRDVGAESLRFVLTISVLLAITTIATLPGQAVYDHVILLPGILIMVRYWRELRRMGRVAPILLALGGAVLFWPWAAAAALVLAHALGAGFVSGTVLALPIRTAASLPFAVIALLGYAVRADARDRSVRA